MIFACDDNENTHARMYVVTVSIALVIVYTDMSMAWRARDPLERIAYARKAIKANERYRVCH